MGLGAFEFVEDDETALVFLLSIKKVEESLEQICVILAQHRPLGIRRIAFNDAGKEAY